MKKNFLTSYGALYIRAELTKRIADLFESVWSDDDILSTCFEHTVDSAIGLLGLEEVSTSS
jgi:hypothetical protein